jgi:hypothetical protein
MENEVMPELKIHGTRPKRSNKESIKVEFDLSDSFDADAFKHLNKLLDRINQNNALKKVKVSEFLKRGIPYLKEADCAKIRNSLLTKRERMELITQNYNAKQGTSLSVEDFMMDVYHGLTKKDVKQLQKIMIQ